MKNMIRPRFLLFIMSTFLLCAISCKKNNDPKTKTELITQGSWKFSTATASGVDVSGSLQTCQKDNIYAFVAAGTGTADEGSTKCNPGDSQSGPFSWNFASSETILHISTPLFAGGSNDFTLVTLSDTQLILSQNIPPFGTVIVTLVH